MNDTELQTLLSQRSGTEQRIHAALLQHGKSTDKELRVLISSPGSGPRDAVAKMLPLGLVRIAGKADTKGRPTLFEATPAAEVEQAAAKYGAMKRKRKARRSPMGGRLGDLRKMEQGDVREWHPTREKLLAALPVLTNTVKMALWESVPPDELEFVIEEIEAVREAADDALGAIRERLEHEKIKDRIEKMEQTQGRTDAEVAVFERKAKALKTKLIERDATG